MVNPISLFLVHVVYGWPPCCLRPIADAAWQHHPMPNYTFHWPQSWPQLCSSPIFSLIVSRKLLSFKHRFLFSQTCAKTCLSDLQASFFFSISKKQITRLKHPSSQKFIWNFLSKNIYLRGQKSFHINNIRGIRIGV